MIAFHDVRSQMRESAIHLTNPVAMKAGAPVRIVRSREPASAEDEDTHIEPWMEIAFKALTHASETGEPFALVSCFMNGQPAALIAATYQQGNRTHVLPLFMAVQPGMHFAPHDGDSDDGDEGKAPDRGEVPEPG